MTPKRCDNCLYEYACDWSKAENELRCEDWKPEVMSNGSRTEEHRADLHEDGKDDPGWCEWTLIDAEFNAYDTSCRNPWYLEAGTPEDNKMIYCPACGRKIKVVKEKKLRLEDVTRCPYCNYIPKCNEQTCKDCKVYEDFLDGADDLLRFGGKQKNAE